MRDSKNRNRGLAIWEMLVVIAVLFLMVVLLFPIVQKYVGNKRLSKDIECARNIEKAMQDSLLDSRIRENAKEHDTPISVSEMDGSEFRRMVFEKLGEETVQGKTKKDLQGAEFKDTEYYYTLNLETRKIEIYYGGITAEYQMYPLLGDKFIEKDEK